MLLRLMPRFAFRFLLPLLLLGFPAVAQAQTGLLSLRGEIAVVEGAGKTPRITIDARSATDDQFVKLQVNRRTRISLMVLPPHEPAARVARSGDLDLIVGRHVEVEYEPFTRVAKSIILDPPTELWRSSGILTAVGPDDRFGLDGNGDGIPDMQFQRWSTGHYLGPTRVRHEQLSLLVGLPVTVYHNLDSSLARLVLVAAPEVQQAEGTLTAVEAGVPELSVRTRHGMLKLAPAPGTEFVARGGELTLGALRAGDRVRVQYAALPSGTQLALQVTAPNLRVQGASGRLKAVAPDAGTFTTSQPPKAYTLAVDAPLFASWEREPYQGTDLQWLAAYLKFFRRIDLHIEYVMRGKVRVATRVAADLTGQIPPSPPN